MARQVLTYPDIPPVLTQAAADTRYSLVAHNHDAAYATVAHLHTGVYLPVSHEPGTDPHPQYYNQARGDARYLQTTTAASTYSPLGHNHAATYVDVVGDTMTGALRVDNHVSLGAPVKTWVSGLSVVQLGNGGFVMSNTVAVANGTVTLGYNTAVSTAWDWKAVVAERGIMATFGPDGLHVTTAPSVAAGASQTFVDRLWMASYGTVTMNSDPAYMVLNLNRPEPMAPPASTPMLALQRAGSNRWHIGVDHTDQFAVYAADYATPLTLNQNGTLSLAPVAGNAAISFGAAGSVAVDTGAAKMYWGAGGGGHDWLVAAVSWMQLNGTALYPPTSGSRDLGWTNGRWGTLYSVNAVNVSSQEMKNDLGLLDPEAALAEVLRVPVHRFTYKRAEPRDLSTPQAREMAAAARVYDEYERIGYMAEEAAVEKGDALLLVGPDGVDPQNTASVVMAAVQALALRVAELQARLA